MTFQSDAEIIRWRLHLKSDPQRVYAALASDEGRASFWAESAREQDGVIHFTFPNRIEWKSKVLVMQPAHKYSVEYYGGSVSSFDLTPDGAGGTELILTDRGVPAEDRGEVIAGWVSVLLALKASLDFGVDLRNHDPQRNWDQGYVEN